MDGNLPLLSLSEDEVLEERCLGLVGGFINEPVLLADAPDGCGAFSGFWCGLGRPPILPILLGDLRMSTG